MIFLFCYLIIQFSLAQSFSCVWLFATPWTTAHQASLSITNSWSLLTLMSFELVMPSSHLTLCRPLLFLPSSGSFQMSQLFTSGGQIIGVAISVLPMNTQDWSPLGWTGWISLQSKGLSRVFSNTTVQKHQFFGAQFLYSPTLTSIHDHWKNHSLDYMDLCWQNNVSAFNMLSRLVITFLPRSKRLLISWLQSPPAVILEPRKIVSPCFHCFHIYLPWSDGTGCHDLCFLNVESLSQLLHSPLSLSSRGSSVPLCFLP